MKSRHKKMANKHVTLRVKRARAIAAAGGVGAALESGSLDRRTDLALSEALVLGLVRQGVRKFIGIFGHGVTDVGDVLRVYEDAGVVKTYAVRHEAEAVHAATALRWVAGEKAAVFTSIGPGALHALAASLAPLSDGIGVWFLLGDETTEDEGPNMQQIPGHEQDRFLKLFSAMGNTYKLHTPLALNTALRRGLATVNHPYRSGPFYLLLPMNTQAALMPSFNLDELPFGSPPPMGAAADGGQYKAAADRILAAQKVVIKVGGGCRGAEKEIAEFMERVDGVAVLSPLVSGIVPFSHPRNMTVGGSKGSICGNFAMQEADLLVALGTRFVCQSDCSRTGYPRVQQVVNINADPYTAGHYGRSTALVGDVRATLLKLNQALARQERETGTDASAWLKACRQKRVEWDRFRQARYDTPCLYDDTWQAEVLTQPAAIKTAADWAREHKAISFFDAGDVQANGFQIVEDEHPGKTISETGASYMGFAASALMATAMSDNPFYGLAFSGDGSFVMNPQILIDGAAHGVTGCILLLDNRSMAAISGLQQAQYEHVYATFDHVVVDYKAWAAAIRGVAAFDGGAAPQSLQAALDKAYAHKGLSLIHVPVYAGDDPLGNMGVFGRWNVGNWCEETQALRHDIGL
jgi:3D-(3,5/4)-trihydroxycyclohexane-1,2-dione acylhydrolase (decyclizing)